MKAIITNKFTVIQNPTNDIVQQFEKILSYKDKQKEFQVARLEKNKFYKNINYIAKLKKEINGSLLKRINNNNIAFNSGLSYLVKDFTIEDKRVDTGPTIALPWKKTPNLLRPYQEDAVNVALSNWRGILNMATGMGKSLTALYIIKKLKRKALVVVPSESIANQFYKDLSEAFGPQVVGYFGGGKKKTNLITVGIAASVLNSIDVFKKEELGLIIFDEVHHIAADTFFSISSALGDVGRIYGLTATDYRSDGKDILINASCGEVLIRRDVKWGISNGFLAKPKFIVKEVPTLGTDYKNDKLKNYKEHVLNSTIMKNQILNDIKYYQSLGKTVLCLVGEVAHGEELSKQLGVPLAQGSDKQSQEYINQLNAGTIKTLIGTAGKISEGSDTKSVDVLIMAHFVASKGAVMQSVGRALRVFNNKTEATILDYVPKGSSMLTRHAKQRILLYKDITNDVNIV